MDTDATMLEDGTTLETDVCVVGAGPAGIVLGHELAVRGRDVLMLESGGLEDGSGANTLNRGRTRGTSYAGLEITRNRQVGGSARMWNTVVGDEPGAKYAPLDPVDLDRVVEFGGWPLSWSGLEPWYRRAQVACRLGPFSYDADAWHDGVADPPDLGPSLCSRVYQLGAARAVTDDLLVRARRTGRFRLCTHATVLRLVRRTRDRAVDRAEAAETTGNRRFDVRARIFVIAGGAIENARLLLLSRTADSPRGLGNDSNWVGRCFMEHPRDHSLILVPDQGLDRFGFYDVRVARDGTVVAGRIALTDAFLRETWLPNASATLLPCKRRSPLSRFARMTARYPRASPGWSTHTDRSTLAAFHLLLNVEQLPHPENRVRLGSKRDRFGLPRAELTWRWSSEDARALARVRSHLSDALQERGIGRIESSGARHPNPNAHHHAGTTRMSEDPAHGVVDANGRVHGTDNVYAAGASVFPTAGFANPMLTIVALALRLADHLNEAS